MDELLPDVPGSQIQNPVAQAIHEGERKYKDIAVPILAIFANPHSPKNYFPNLSQDKTAKLVALDRERTEAQIRAFEKLKAAKVIALPNAEHYVFLSNEEEVERAMKGFINSLDTQTSK